MNCIRTGEWLVTLLFFLLLSLLCTKSILYGGMNISTQADLNSRVFFLWCKMIFNSHLNVLISQYIRIEFVNSADCTCSGCATISYHFCNMTGNRFMMMCGMQMSLWMRELWIASMSITIIIVAVVFVSVDFTVGREKKCLKHFTDIISPFIAYWNVAQCAFTCWL